MRRAVVRVAIAIRAILRVWRPRTLQEPVRDDEGYRERLVADLVEEDDHLVLLVPLDLALAPLPVADARADGEWHLLRLVHGDAGLADVAVPAGRIKALAEVAEEEPTAALARLGVAPDHVDARAVERATVGLCRRGLLDLAAADLAVG